MNHRIYYPILAILVLVSCSPQIPEVAIPQPPPTVTALLLPTSGPIQVETPGAPFYAAGEPVGSISIPASGDAGNFFLYAGSIITLTWNEPPLDAARYDFTMLDTSGIPMVIGTDLDSTDGVSVNWFVPANLPGYEVGGTAYSAEGQAIYFAYGGTVYSREAPPQDVCTLSNNTIGAFPVHLEPNSLAQVFAELTPGLIVQVYERITDDWYRIDASKLEVYSNTTLICGESPTSPCRGYSNSATGWVHVKEGIRFFGPCDRFSLPGGLEENQDSVSPHVTTPIEIPVYNLTNASPTEITSSPQVAEQTGLVIFGQVTTGDGSGLANVKIFISLAAYSGEVVATTDENGNFRSNFKFIPGDENVTVWAELEGYSFAPPSQYWRHYYGYEERILNFVAIDSLLPYILQPNVSWKIFYLLSNYELIKMRTIKILAVNFLLLYSFLSFKYKLLCSYFYRKTIITSLSTNYTLPSATPAENVVTPIHLHPETPPDLLCVGFVDYI